MTRLNRFLVIVGVGLLCVVRAGKSNRIRIPEGIYTQYPNTLLINTNNKQIYLYSIIIYYHQNQCHHHRHQNTSSIPPFHFVSCTQTHSIGHGRLSPCRQRRRRRRGFIPEDNDNDVEDVDVSETYELDKADAAHNANTGVQVVPPRVSGRSGANDAGVDGIEMTVFAPSKSDVLRRPSFIETNPSGVDQPVHLDDDDDDDDNDDDQVDNIENDGDGDIDDDDDDDDNAQIINERNKRAMKKINTIANRRRMFRSHMANQQQSAGAETSPLMRPPRARTTQQRLNNHEEDDDDNDDVQLPARCSRTKHDLVVNICKFLFE